MPYGRGFGFRGGSPGWPFIGRGRGGLSRCWAYGANWRAPYTNPNWFGASAPPFPGDWGPYGMEDSYFAPYLPTMGGGAGFYESPMASGEGEREWLKRQAESIRQEIDRIKNRISELEQE